MVRQSRLPSGDVGCVDSQDAEIGCKSDVVEICRACTL